MHFDISVDLKNSFAILIPTEDGETQPVRFERLDVDHPHHFAFYDADDNPVRIIPRTSVRQINFQQLLPNTKKEDL